MRGLRDLVKLARTVKGSVSLKYSPNAKTDPWMAEVNSRVEDPMLTAIGWGETPMGALASAVRDRDRQIAIRASVDASSAGEA